MWFLFFFFIDFAIMSAPIFHISHSGSRCNICHGMKDEKEQICAFDGQGVNLCILKWPSTGPDSCNPAETPINIEVADDTVSSVQRRGPGINQRGIKDCPMCYRSPLVLDSTFCSL